MRTPTNFKNGVAIQPNAEMTRATHLSLMESEVVILYNSLDGWEEFGSDRIPDVYGIQQKLLIYGKIYELLGELAGECERFVLWCDAKKKNEYETYMIENENEPGTMKMKEIHASKVGHKYRTNRDYFKGLAELWRNRMDTTKEKINILKWMIKDSHEANRGN